MRILTLLCLLLLCGCKRTTETLDYAQRPQPDAISAPLGRYPLNTPVTTYFDAGHIYVSPDAALSDTDRATLTAALAGTVQPVLADAMAYANAYCLPATGSTDEATARVRIRLYYGPFPKATRLTDTARQLVPRTGQAVAPDYFGTPDSAELRGLPALQPDIAALVAAHPGGFDPQDITGQPASELRRLASAALLPPNASSGYSGLCQLAYRSHSIEGAQVWLNTAPLYDFLQQAKLLYPYDAAEQLRWARAQWGGYCYLVLRHEYIGHACFGLRDEPTRAGPGMMHNRWLSGEWNPAELATANWLRQCKAQTSRVTSMTEEEWK